MIKYIAIRTKEMKSKILAKAREEFGNVNTHIFWEGKHWWIRVFISKEDIIEYNAIEDDNGDIDFEVRW